MSRHYASPLVLLAASLFALSACMADVEKSSKRPISSYTNPANQQNYQNYLARQNAQTRVAATKTATKPKPTQMVAAPAPRIVEIAKIDTRDQQCLAEAMYFEARGTGENGMRAVGEVILNRAEDDRFPSAVCDVVDQRFNGSCQFSYRCDGLPEKYHNQGQKALAERIAGELLSARGHDITKGALFFHAATIKPAWFATLDKRGKFGGQYFYR